MLDARSSFPPSSSHPPELLLLSSAEEEDIDLSSLSLANFVPRFTALVSPVPQRGKLTAVLRPRCLRAAASHALAASSSVSNVPRWCGLPPTPISACHFLEFRWRRTPTNLLVACFFCFRFWPGGRCGCLIDVAMTAGKLYAWYRRGCFLASLSHARAASSSDAKYPR